MIELTMVSIRPGEQVEEETIYISPEIIDGFYGRKGRDGTTIWIGSNREVVVKEPCDVVKALFDVAVMDSGL